MYAKVLGYFSMGLKIYPDTQISNQIIGKAVTLEKFLFIIRRIQIGPPILGKDKSAEDQIMACQYRKLTVFLLTLRLFFDCSIPVTFNSNIQSINLCNFPPSFHQNAITKSALFNLVSPFNHIFHG